MSTLIVEPRRRAVAAARNRSLRTSPVLLDVLRAANVSEGAFLADFVLCRCIYGYWWDGDTVSAHYIRYLAAAAMIRSTTSTPQGVFAVAGVGPPPGDRSDQARTCPHEQRLLPDLIARLRGGIVEIRVKREKYEIRAIGNRGELRLRHGLPETVKIAYRRQPINRLVDAPLLANPDYVIRRFADRSDGSGLSVYFSAKAVPIPTPMSRDVARADAPPRE